MTRVSKSELAALRNSGLFDEKWYLEQYPDVKLLGMDPLEHYLWLGMRLQRPPSAKYSYLDVNAEVARAKTNPVPHHIHDSDRGSENALMKPDVGDTPKEKHRLKIAVISWDVGHNPVGRAYLLAEALSRRFEVVLLGPQFERFGRNVWEPIRNGKIPVISFPGRDYPEFDGDLADVAEHLDCDVIVACKPRMPSLQLALLAKKKLNRPLILDIDDHELAFCSEFSRLSLADLAASNASDLKEPYGSSWTRFAETLIPCADAILVSNEALRSEFGGTVIPHARDEKHFDPARFDRKTCRAKLGLKETDKIVLFAGTARAHKGLIEIASAMGQIGRSDYKLCIVGDILDQGFKSRIADAAEGRAVFFPNQPLDALPNFLAACDVVCLLQDQTSHISQFQLPAKLIDALAMGVPVLATETPPLRPLIKQGCVISVTPENLKKQLQAALEDSGPLRQKLSSNRALFLKQYSYQAIADRLEKIVLSALKNPTPLPDSALEFREIQRRLSRPSSPSAYSRPSTENASGRYDMVMFWKQHDTGVYGRRSDMLAKYFARHPDIKRVLMVDAPLWHGDLMKKGGAVGINEHGFVYKEIQARSLGLRDKGNLTFHSFIYHTGQRHPLARWQYPRQQDYLEWLEKLIADHEVDPRRAIFWLFPVNEVLGSVVERFNPNIVVTDIVDDQRQQPGTTYIRKKHCEKNYRDLAKISDLVVTNCKPIQDSMASFAPHMKLLPNACEIEPAEDRPEFDLQRLLNVPEPRLGYVGNLESKLDIRLLEYVATARPDWNIVLVGSAHTRSEVLELDRYPNVHFMGVVPYEEARVWIRRFNVALMPHLNTPLTQSMNPLKLFVYLAQGVPVVSTPTPNTEELGDLMHVAHNYEEFVQSIDLALNQKGSMNAEDLNDAMLKHSWKRRVSTAMDMINRL